MIFHCIQSRSMGICVCLMLNLIFMLTFQRTVTGLEIIFPNGKETYLSPENLTVGSPVTYVLADSEDVDFSITKGTPHLRLDDGTGSNRSIILENPWNTRSVLLTFEFTARSKKPSTETAKVSYRVFIQDVNDNPPVFAENSGPRILFWPENTMTDVPLFTLNAADTKDGSTYGTEGIVFRMEFDSSRQEEYLKFFRTKTNYHDNNKMMEYLIYLNQKFDYETTNMYRFSVVASDNNGKLPCNTANFDITINVEDMDDEDPQFTRVPSLTKLKENSPKGTEVLRVEAVDGDRAIQAPIKYKIVEGNLFNTCKIDEKRGIVTVENSPDREAFKGDFVGFTLLITATEYLHEVEGRNSNVSCTVIVEDENDCEPKFGHSSYEAEIEENSPVGVAVKLMNGVDFIEVTDDDESMYAGFKLEILKDQHGIFKMKPLTGTLRETFGVQVANQALLDFETLKPNPLQLKLKASDNSKSNANPTFTAEAIFTLHVRDVNDEFPVFDLPLYNFSIQENSEVGTFVAEVKATDKDCSLDFGTQGIRYSLLKTSTLEQFQIDSFNGSITVQANAALDYEQTPILYLTVEAKDNNGAGNWNTTQVVVNLIDVNDNAPEFTSSYSATLEENRNDFQIPLIIREAKDVDEGINAEIDYNIAGKHGHYFQLNSTRIKDEKLLVPLEPLDYEKICPDTQTKCTLEVIVVATDRGDPPLSGNTTVKVTFMDVNDVRPAFSHSDVYVILNETAEGGTFVAEVHASDLDITQNFRKISYEIADGNDSPFVIKSVDGVIRTGPRADLRISSNDGTMQYNITITATDGAENSDELNKVCVVINITDINNEAPEFSQKRYKATILEDAPVNTILNFDAKITATDVDSTADLVYNIVLDNAEAIGPEGDSINNPSLYDSLFQVDNTGQVSVKTELDRETVSRLIMELQVVDKAAETENPPQTATATLTIIIGDVNDNAPEFPDAPYHTMVMENSAVNTKIEPIVKAIDIDSNKTITYTLDGEARFLELVNISETDGRLTVKSEIDREEVAEFAVLVVATDSGIPPMSSSVTFNITVLDANDNAPNFTLTSYAVSVSEDSAVNDSIITLTATDRDAGDFGTVMYILPDGKNFFSIDQDGVISVMSPLDCDYVQDHTIDPIVTLEVFARDNKNIFPYQTGSTFVYISITDVNDNPPKVEISEEIVSPYEDRRVGEVLQNIRAVDPDKGENGSVLLYLNEDYMAPHIKGFFDIEMKTDKSGDLIVKSSPLPVGMWEVNIIARDHGTPPLTGDNTLLKIKVQDVNDHAPVIHEPNQNQHFQVAMDQDNHLITKINATDEDYEDNGRIKFSLPLEYDNKFKIVPSATTNGIAELHLIPNSEQIINTYEFSITASDLGEPSLNAEVEITVKVKPRSHYPPEFKIITNAQVSFTEEEAANSVRHNLMIATDEDATEEEPVDICYFIVDGDPDELFSLDKTSNVITTRQVLDRDCDGCNNYTLYIFATNHCDSPPHLENIASDLKNGNASYLRLEVEIEDINDNPPTFGTKKIFTGGVDNQIKPGEKVILQVKATDLDIGENAKMLYSIKGDVTKQNAKGMDGLDLNECIVIEKTSGNIRTGCIFDELMKGYLEFSVSVSNILPVITPKDDLVNHEDITTVKIYVLRADQKLKFTMVTTPQAFYAVKDKFISALAKQLGVIVNIDDVQISTDKTSQTEVTAHFVNPDTNEVYEPADILKQLDNKDSKTLNELKTEFHIFEIKEITQNAPTNDQETLTQILIIAAAGAMAAMFVVLLTAYCFRVNKLERKLKAATTSAFDNNVTTDSPMAELPTTNVHAKDGSNPLYNYEFDGNDPRLFESNDTDSIISGESLVEDSNAFDGGKNNGGFPGMMDSFFVTETDEPKKKFEDIEMENKINSNFSMKRPDEPSPTSDNFTMKRPDNTEPTNDNFILRKEDNDDRYEI